MSKVHENQEEMINVCEHIISLIVFEEPHRWGLGTLRLFSRKNPVMSSVLCELLGYGTGAVGVFWYTAPLLGFVLLRKCFKVAGSVVSVVQQVEQILT
jgi:hypothetical protein